ncbi:MAG: dTDP-4-dehydrorhamnose 3,5-epimerase [Alicyclobacillaceae bacterium]|uniref:dTDP-4-dehydrorhamnose 3,5-epimerase n=1 Tax=Alicyclobacillus sp. SP_1 TaxID=2942475 RepID=UPI0021571FD6|nr:dTDP-4-dehydrorhamnose 3,5-epimerase [Alicyclobacillus sp. SP_1]MCY0887310.1 dTDP-4-dehydrorhamnose 3,5-epimerase [Alicyclobacillaceae bacterium]
MKVVNQKFDGVMLLEPEVHGDHRGFFLESYHADEWRKIGISNEFVQDNHSFSAQPGTLRGLHYQLSPYAQGKLVRVTAGAVYDVVVDIRKQSPTFGQWAGFLLTAANYRQLWVPRGFAHGFCTVVPDTEVQYKVDQYYSPIHDRGILWNDEALGIIWPFSDPVLSEKDQRHPVLAKAEL